MPVLHVCVYVCVCMCVCVFDCALCVCVPVLCVCVCACALCVCVCMCACALCVCVCACAVCVCVCVCVSTDATSPWHRPWACLLVVLLPALLAQARQRPPKIWAAASASTLSSSTALTRWTTEGWAASTKVTHAFLVICSCVFSFFVCMSVSALKTSFVLLPLLLLLLLQGSSMRF